MGWDMHVYAEKRNSSGGWEYVPCRQPCGYRNPPSWTANEFMEPVAMFALAGLGREIDLSCTISSPRGVPSDLSPQLATSSAGEQITSWVTMAEIEAFDWDQKFTMACPIDRDQTDGDNYEYVRRDNCFDQGQYVPVKVSLRRYSANFLAVVDKIKQNVDCRASDVRLLLAFDF